MEQNKFVRNLSNNSAILIFFPEIDTTALTTEFATTEDGIERYACPEEFLQLTIDWCFHFRYNIDDRLDFTESQDYCSIKDAILPAITSEDVSTIFFC